MGGARIGAALGTIGTELPLSVALYGSYSSSAGIALVVGTGGGGRSIDCLAFGAAWGGGGGTARGAEDCDGGGAGGRELAKTSSNMVLSVKLASRLCGGALSASLCLALDAISVS